MSNSFLHETSEGVYLSVKVQPRASRNALAGMIGHELKVCVTAPPVDSAANLALVEFIADLLGASRSTVQIVKGTTSRHKKLFLAGFTSASVLAKLKAS